MTQALSNDLSGLRQCIDPILGLYDYNYVHMLYPDVKVAADIFGFLNWGNESHNTIEFVQIWSSYLGTFKPMTNTADWQRLWIPWLHTHLRGFGAQ